jgi:hypothetical protein
MTPPVGIGVTLRNRAAYLREALDSLLTQTYRNVQFALVKICGPRTACTSPTTTFAEFTKRSALYPPYKRDHDHVWGLAKLLA